MIINQYDFFEKEFEKYKQFLLEYKKDNSKIFVDENFHPQNKDIDETKLNQNLKKYSSYSSLKDDKIKWKRIDEVYKAPLFNKEKIHPLFIKQGKIGDCYFITALTRIAKKGELVQSLFEKKLPDKILGEVPDSINIKCGAVVVYFRVFGRRTPVLIDTQIPFINTNNETSPLFSSAINRDKSAWFCLVEKAFAKLNGSYSNIISGHFSESFYTLYGYYNKHFFFSDDMTKDTFKILRYQKCGCLMDSVISTKDQTKIDAAKAQNLVENHSYLLLKVRKYQDIIFFQLRNPWGDTEFNGDYSKNSSLLTPELQKLMKDEEGLGLFWISAKDFFKHYNIINVSKPIDPHWTMRIFYFEVDSTTDDGNSKLDQHKNFAFQLLEDIQPGQKARVRIVVEKRNKDYKKLRMEDCYLYVYYGRNNGKKLVKTKFGKSSLNVVTVSTKIADKNDIVTFVIVAKAPESVKANCYVNVFCECDFKLYDIDNPTNLFHRGETRGAIMDNFSITEPNAALVLKRTIINGKEFFWMKNPTQSDFNKQKKDANFEIIIKNLITEVKTSHNILPASQVNTKKFIFNKELIAQGSSSKVYKITEIETGDEYAATINLMRVLDASDPFYRKVSIMMKLKYPSIANFIGFSETNFSQEPNPMVITGLYPQGSLFDNIKNLTSTKKMIILIGVAFGMNYIHKHNIILRDLHSSNILLDQNMHPKIAYFNKALINSYDNEKLDFMKIPFHFFAPEVFSGAEPYSFPVDVFAFGMLFYHVISDKEPTISNNNRINFFMKIQSGELPSLDGIPTRHHEFIKSMWEKDPAKRPTFDEIIKKLLYSKYECRLKGADLNEIESYIHQFGATLKTRNQTDYVNIINGIKNKLPPSISSTVNDLKESTLVAKKETIISLAKDLYNKPLNNESINISIDLAHIAADLNSTEAFVFLGNAYQDGKGVKKNAAMAAFSYKVAADRGETAAMFEYASILMKFFTKTIKLNDKKRMLKEGRETIAYLDGKNDYFYEEARLCFDTIESSEASLYAARMYFEKASKKGDQKSTNELKNINNIHGEIPCQLQYFEELCLDLTDEMINKKD